jgi:hypothetical protein
MVLRDLVSLGTMEDPTIVGFSNYTIQLGRFDLMARYGSKNVQYTQKLM